MEKVIEDLNVLDSENYFRIIDLSVENKVAEVMVLLNDIIGKGFDGGHLVSGLANHVRNVLMAKDPQTLPLLEVSQRQVEKFKEQATKCPIPFLYKALKLMNDCDIYYRQSSNKRLLVELTLIQIAQITQEDDVPVAGRSPKRLKSLFKKNQANIQKQAAQQVAASGSTLPKNEAPKVEAESHAPVANTKEAPTSTRPRISINSIPTLSFNSILQKDEPKQAAKEEEDVKNVEEQKVFNEEDLLFQWHSMCRRMPQSMAGISARMRNLTPKITDFPNIEIVVDNDNLLNQMKNIRGKIRSTLVLGLHNNQININMRLAEAHEVKKVLTRKEHFDEMRKQNPSIEKLRAQLDLELA